MGSSGKEEAGIGDCGVGSIVWVRRRNGSWWPGKILGTEELSAVHLVSPRSGTPVKLLGREDASVDWYNLEKSKRVKPFRCGEFDECIEKAEAALGLPPKKREKYARREDAILHALELEKQQLDDKSGYSGSPVGGYCEKSSDTVKKESAIYSELSDHGNSKIANLKPSSKKLLVSTNDEDINDSICQPQVNIVNEMGEDVTISEQLPRVSGSQGLGPRSTLVKQKLLSATSLNGSGKLELDNFNQDIPFSDLIYESSVIPGMQSSLGKKRKSANDALPNEPLAKRRDRRRTLVQVLQKSEKLPSRSSLQLSEEENIEPTSHAIMNRIYLPSDSYGCYDDDLLVSHNEMARSPHVDMDDFSRPTALDEESASESTESTETDSSKTHSMDSDEDGLLAGPELLPEMEPISLERSLRGSTSSMIPDDNDGSLFYPRDSIHASLGASQWQSKRKRTNPSLSKRSTQANERWVARRSMYTADLEEVESDGFEETGVLERNFRAQKLSYYNQEYISNQKTSFRGYDKLIDWENLAWNEQPLMSGYWERPSTHFGSALGGHRFGGKMKSGLVDVDLKVQTRYQREHVPMISLMSKLNGKAIVGHPIQVQVLEYGSTDSLLEKSDNDAMVNAAWKTARRSNYRDPRSRASTEMDGEENTGILQTTYHNKKAAFRKSNGTRKGLSHGKFSKKPSKKIGLSSSSQKTRNLSAIGREQKFGNNFGGENKTSFRAGGLMKGNAGMAPVACIPLKLVFCRLNEELVDRHNNNNKT